ncbi:MAG TPA: TAT-variant-translocated molybdopterin oxidoreductase [Ignavibacteriaceae bacterium]|nr:TAT-variant-translocated molybdopterin oxidoreductase [Ignavibacteriaceae bacterium]
MSDTKNDNLDNKKPEPNYWKSFNDLYNDPNFLTSTHDEFKEETKEDFDPNKLSGLSRRKFIALLGASAALAGAGCSNYRDKGEIIPYNKKPEEIILGEPNFYASTCTSCANACGILIRTREGRPVKIDGNPDHPVNQGKICSKGHASILNLYNPERYKEPQKNRGGYFNAISWEKANNAILNELKKGEKEIALITGKIFSPTTKKLLEEFKAKYPTTKIYSFEMFDEAARNNAWRKSAGGNFFPLIKWDEAKIIVTLEGDFLGTEGHTVENQRLYAKGRDVNNINSFNRLYAIEGNMSITGMNADYRLRLNPAAQAEFVQLLISEVGGSKSINRNDFVRKYKINSKTLELLIKDLKANKGKAIVYAGNVLPEDVHIAVNHLNQVLGGNTLYRTDAAEVEQLPFSNKDELNGLISAINNNAIGAVIHIDTNPVYHFPKEYNYENILRKAPLVVTLTEVETETASLSNYILPLNHNYESWGDSQTRTGVVSLVQPVIAPLFNTRQKEAILLAWINQDAKKYSNDIYLNYLKKNWESNFFTSTGSGDFNNFWLTSLHDGIVFTNETAPSNGGNASASSGEMKFFDNKGMTLLIQEHPNLGDGSYANNGWMMELPHPVSKVTWDNYAAISLNTSKKLDVEIEDLIEVKVKNRTLELPVFIQPGIADDLVVIESGFGRTNAGTVGTGNGFDVNRLISVYDAGLSKFIYTGVQVRKTSGTYKLATTQEHHTFDEGYTKDQHKKRGIIREGTVNEYKNNPKFLKESKGIEQTSLYNLHAETRFSDVKWGMAIDLNKCLGCGECTVACNAENNVPVVGKDQVIKGREMHWLRIDRYYSGSPDEPNVSAQPMLCQHCDHAPCENVCPVAATTHSIDGLNQMVYNRCVGTRYCSNNCPFKVRRFNFYNFRSYFKDDYQMSDVFSLVFNPEVTVRSRGVMEKCTFCIQRIMKAREDAIQEGRAITGSEVKTACQEACVTGAITFGNIKDKESEVGQWKEHDLTYYVLEELNVRPNISYVAKLRNTHPEEV